MDLNKLAYSRTIEVGPEQAELLNHLVDKYIVPVLEKRQRIAQGALPRKKLTPEEEIDKILSFGSPQSVQVPDKPPRQQSTKKIAQGGLGFNTKELRDLESLLAFGQSSGKPTQEGAIAE